ncbi:MAG: dTDP-4-dehydrorhamnose 3,5-epimerase [Gammaproteobacteria bacterium]|nr:MAG: dTDP-4-dehydrorhamnose 3,5-epimerase [Gammaproteobacteria bacterium]
MNLDVNKTELDGVLLIKPFTQFEDFRGNYIESYNEKAYKKAGITSDFIQDDISTSKYNVLRGLHGDEKTEKLVTCPYGSLFFVAVNNNPLSKQYKKWFSTTLSDKNKLQVYVPSNFAIGFLVVSEVGLFQYKQTTYYEDCNQFTLAWNDPQLNIAWPVDNPILSKRDMI